MGAAIDGEPGLGFQLRAEHFLPPLMFNDEELEALVLGLRGLIYGPDSEMAATARDAASKIAYGGYELPPARKAGIKVKDVAELVDKLRNEARVV
jgi:predicted DNA-binding transcriptional regulator YafY